MPHPPFRLLIEPKGQKIIRQAARPADRHARGGGGFTPPPGDKPRAVRLTPHGAGLVLRSRPQSVPSEPNRKRPSVSLMQTGIAEARRAVVFCGGHNVPSVRKRDDILRRGI